VKDGLTFRPIEATCRDTLAWWPGELKRRERVTREIQDEARAKGDPVPQMADPSKIRAGMTPESEAKILKDWHAAQG
jgi:hypothetical protein